MTPTRIAVSSVALLALLTACGSSAGSTAPATSSAASTPSSAPSEQESGTPTPDDSSTPGATTSGLATSLVALQLCGTTLGYAAGAIAGVPAEQLTTLEKGVESAQGKAGAVEAELLAQSRAVVDAAKGGDQAAITAAGQKMGELCGAG